MAELRLGPADNGRTIEVAVGTRVVLAVPETPSTGYGWATQPGSSDVVELEADAFEPPVALQPGAGGMHGFRFRARASGHAKLRLVLRRPWAPQDIVERYEVTLQVMDGARA